MLRNVSLFKYLCARLHTLTVFPRLRLDFSLLFCVFFSEAREKLFREHLLVSGRKKTNQTKTQSSMSREVRLINITDSAVMAGGFI